jgi:lipopolysaccharide exporter
MNILRKIDFGRGAAQMNLLFRKNSVLLIGSNGATLIARIVSTMVLTRMLDASAFGAVAMITTFGYILHMLTDFGFYPFVVRSPHSHDSDFLDKVWTVRLCRAVAIVLIFMALSKPLAIYVDVPGLEYGFAIGSMTMVFDGLASMASATAARDQQIGRLSFVELVSAITTIVVSIISAFFIRNYWAIIIGIVAGSLLRTTLSYTMFPGSRRRFVIDKPMFHEIWAFGRFIMPSSVITMLINQSDKFVLARAFDLKTFGLYSLASNLAFAPLSLMGAYTAQILYPSFAAGHRNHPSAMAGIFYATGKAVRILFMFVCGGAITAAPLLIALLYDDRYLEAAKFFSVLTIVNLLNFLISTENELFVAIGKIKIPLYLNILRIASIIICAPFLYSFSGAIGLVWAFAVGAAIAQAANSFVLARMGVFRLRGELVLWTAVGFGMAAGYFAVILARGFWHSIPLPFG